MFDRKDYEDEQLIKELQKKADDAKAIYDKIIKELRALVYKIERG